MCVERVLTNPLSLPPPPLNSFPPSMAVSALSNSLSTLRTGRASPAMLDRVMVSYYGADTPLNSLATVSVSSAQQLTIQPFDKGSSGDIEKAIIESDLGLTPNNSGDLIRINIPSLTEERRKEMVKLCKSMGEEAKVSVRNARRDGVDKVKKLGERGQGSSLFFVRSTL